MQQDFSFFVFCSCQGLSRNPMKLMRIDWTPSHWLGNWSAT
jgi:hypothetical protein